MAKDEHLNVKEKTEETKSPKSKTPSSADFSTTSKESHTDGALVEKKHTVLCTPTSAFWEIAHTKDEVSRSVASPVKPGLRGRISGLKQKIDWHAWKNSCIEWFKNPMNIAFFIWLVCVAVSGMILFLVMAGFLDDALPKPSQRDDWYEVNNQILNALFTLMCLYQHPQKCYDLMLLIRWNPEDITKLRNNYCKNGTYKPNEWTHMLVVVLLLHLYCFSDYALCGLELGYNRADRPALGVAVCVAFVIAAPAIAGIYSIVSPLGKEYTYDVPIDEESQKPMTVSSSSSSKRSAAIEKSRSFVVKDDETQPKWKGEIFDLLDDISTSSLSLFCTFCVFGWNMERLGFGNTYVHIATFILFVCAPFFIFNLAGLTMNNEGVRRALGISGCILCAFGLLYGGYWRIQMRKRYNLPRYTFCCGKPDYSDCALWFFCFWCSLSQEVRTGNFYDIVEGKFCTKQNNESVDQQSSELHSEDGGMIDNNTNSDPSPQVIPSDDSMISTRNPNAGRAEEDSQDGPSKPMTPPSPVMIEK